MPSVAVSSVAGWKSSAATCGPRRARSPRLQRPATGQRRCSSASTSTRTTRSARPAGRSTASWARSRGARSWRTGCATRPTTTPSPACPTVPVSWRGSPRLTNSVRRPARHRRSSSSTWTTSRPATTVWATRAATSSSRCSARMISSTRDTDTVARLSGDEFAILLIGPGSAHQAERVALRIIDSLRAPVRIGEHLIRTGLSIGLATSDACAASDIDMLRAADLAMYRAKSGGKGRLEVFQPSHHTALLQRDAVRAELSGALDGEQLELHYQPIVDIATQQTVGFEALLRWRHPDRGLVAPLEFIPLAEETGLIVPIGRWVLQEATRQAAEWQNRSPLGRLRMSVNVSVRQFQHPDLVGDVAEALQRSGLKPSLLTLEITESLFAQDTAETTRKIELLKDLGVRLALDDFGTGYSSLSYLRRFPIDTLKIDKSFIDGVATSREGHAVVAAISQLGQTLHLEVVAEGLEDGDQLQALRGLDCPLGQGYHFSRPLAAGDAVKLLLTGKKPASSRISVPA